jgi:hypothetical protein
MISKIFWLHIGLIIGASSIAGFAGNRQIFCAEDSGKAGEGVSDSTKAIQTAIDAAIKAGPGSIVQLQKGRYRLSTEDLQPCLKIEHANDLVIQGQGDNTELIVTNPRCQAINLNDSKSVMIKSLVIDYDPLPYTQGRIVDVNGKDGYFDLDIEEGFPELDQPWFAAAALEKNVSYGMIFDGEKPVFKANAPDHIFISSWEKVKGRVYRLKIRPDYKYKVEYIAKGNRFVYLARLGGKSAGIFFEHCERCGLEEVKIYASNSGAVITLASDGLIFKKYEVKRRPNTNRLLSSNADGIHCQQSRIGPSIEDCLFEYIGDDSLNIYCTISRILDVTKPDELFLSQHCFIKLGDRLQVYDPREGRVLAECTVKALAELPGQRYRVQIDKAVAGIRAGEDHLKADTVFNLSASGEGYVIRNNRFIGQRRYGILARGGKGRIEGNYINGVRGWGIVLANDPGTPEGPVPFDVVIKGNTIINAGASRDCGYREDGGSIVVVNMRAGWELGKGRDIGNIVIKGNKIIDPITAAIFVGGAENITILNNEITASENTPLYEKRGAVRIANCDKVKIDGLKVVDPRPNCSAAIEILADTAADVNSVVIETIETKLHKNAVRVLDKRKQCKQ